MDKKYAGTTIVLPKATVEMLDEIRTNLEIKTGIIKLSRRQVIESLISQKMERSTTSPKLHRRKVSHRPLMSLTGCGGANDGPASFLAEDAKPRFIV